MDGSETEFGRAVAVAREVIAQLGLDPNATCAKREPGEECFTIKRGSAAVLVTVSQRPARASGGGEPHFRVASPIMAAPSDATKRLALFQRLLELNASALVGCAFALLGDRVIVASERPTAGLDAAEAQQMIRSLAHVADTYDDRLKKDFGP